MITVWELFLRAVERRMRFSLYVACVSGREGGGREGGRERGGREGEREENSILVHDTQL